MKKSSLIIFLIFTNFLFAQQPNQEQLNREARTEVREGNKLYNQLKFTDAEVAYKKALSKNPNYEKAAYNLGNTVYQQGRVKEAISNYELAAKTSKDKMSKAEIFHNMGNSFMKEKQYAQAVEAYKNSMRNNSKDEETRYNLALAQKLLKDQQNQQNKDNKDKDNKDNKDKDQKDKDGGDKDKNEDKKDDKDKGKDKKDDKGDEKKDDKNDPEKKDKEQPRPNQLSPEQMKQLLDAMNNEENKTQQKLNEQKTKGRKIKQEKDW